MIIIIIISRTASYEFTLVCLSVRPSVRLFFGPSVWPSVTKDLSLVFFDIIYDDS